MSGLVEEVLNWEEMGITINVPKGVVESGAVCDIAVIPLLHGDFQFPEDSVLVSGVYAIGTSCQIKKPLKISMQHCVNLSTNKHLERMVFFKAEHINIAPPYTFFPCDRGAFETGSAYGSLDCESFTLIAMLRRMRSWITGSPDPSISYRAQVLYSMSPSGFWIVYIFVIKNINHIIEVSCLIHFVAQQWLL